MSQTRARERYNFKFRLYGLVVLRDGPGVNDIFLQHLTEFSGVSAKSRCEPLYNQAFEENQRFVVEVAV